MHPVKSNSKPTHNVDVAILGGGVAGLATALGLRRRGVDAVVFERAPAYDPAVGKGFLLMPNGIATLSQLGLVDQVRAAGSSSLRAIHRSPDSEVLRDVAIPEHLGILRGSLLDVLLRAAPAAAVHTGMNFVGFTGSGSRRQACFANGEKVAARVFVGADGISSQVRRELFGEPRQSLTPVRELVATLRVPRLVARYAGRLYKIEDRPLRRLLGLFAVGGDQLLWYLRWHRRDEDLADLTPAAKKACVAELTAGWPHPAATLVRDTDFSQSVVLDSVLVELPPSFAHDNVVLIGDAAHPIVRLTTQGVNSALEDAAFLTELLATDPGDIRETLKKFSTTRLDALREVMEEGRRQIDAFRHRQDPHAPPPVLTPGASSEDPARTALERLAAWNDQRVVSASDCTDP